MKNTIEIKPGQEIRTESGNVVGQPGQVLSLRDDQPHGWPLMLIDTRTNSVIEVLE